MMSTVLIGLLVLLCVTAVVYVVTAYAYRRTSAPPYPDGLKKVWWE